MEALGGVVLTSRDTREPSKHENVLDLELDGGIPGVHTRENSWSCHLRYVLYDL